MKARTFVCPPGAAVRRVVAALAALSFAVASLAFAPPAHAEGEDVASAVEALAHDIEALSVNTPIWLSQRLPLMMAQVGSGAGVELGSDAGGFSIGLVPIRIGLLNGFSQVGQGLKMLDISDSLPDNLPWPQFGVTAGIGLGAGFELGVDLQFIPDIDLNLLDTITLKVGMISAAAAVRWRINQASGALPSFVIGLGGSYYHGVLGIGAGYSDSYSYEETREENGATVTGRVEGSFAFEGGPEMGWDLFQVTPEVKIAWEIGPVRPYFGFAFGMTFGNVYGGANMSAEVTASFTAEGEARGQRASNTETATWEASRGSFVDVPAAQYLMRPFLGLDVVLGIFAVTLQVDYAVVAQDPLALDYAAVGSSFDPTKGDFLYSDASKNSTLSEALVASLAMRLMF